jgi:hypothetical protein
MEGVQINLWFARSRGFPPSFLHVLCLRLWIGRRQHLDIEEIRQEMRKHDLTVSPMIVVHREYTHQLSPLLDMIKLARAADQAWFRNHGDIQGFARKHHCVHVPVHNYLDRRSVPPTDSVITLGTVEQMTLERFLETTLL